MDFRGMLVSDAAVGLALTVALLLAARANRPFLRDIARDPEAGWRLLARVAAGLTAAAVFWTTAFDKWRQLVDEPARRSHRFPSERVILDPTPEGIRLVTLVLLGAAVLALAPLVARHVGGYALQVVLLLAALALWVPIYAVRQRFDVGLALDKDGSGLADIVGFAAYLAVTWSLNVAVILLMAAALVAAVALPVTLLLDLTGRRCPRATDEATAFFTALHARTTASPDR